MTIDSETWYCKNCPMTNDDCGEFQANSNSFSEIRIIHKDHDGWQKGKPEIKNHVTEIEKLFTEKAVELANDGLFDKDNLKENLRKEKFSIHRIQENVTYKILDEAQKKLHPITINDGTRLILVYLPTEVITTKDEIVKRDYVSRAYFVINGKDGKSIISLDDQKIIQNYSSNIFSGFVILDNRWESKDIRNYISNNQKVIPKDIFDDLFQLEKKYFENEYDYDYYFEPCWITHTYFYTLFEITPYNDYSGMKNVGKSKHLKLLRMLCFNGISSGDSSISSIFRTIQGTGATLLLDETENLKGGKEDRTDLENLLRNGFSKDGMVMRSKETKNKEFHPEFFSVYSPKALGHIHGLDNILEDRCIKTKLRRTTNKNIADSEPDENEDLQIYKTRESLYRLFLDYGDEIYKLIPKAKQLIKELSGREMKLWLPIMTMALFYETHGVVRVVDKITAKMLDTSEDKKISDLEENIDFKILQVLIKIEAIPTQSRLLYNNINELLQSQWKLEPLGDAKVKQSLERLGFRNKRTGQAVIWNITTNKIQEAKERIGLIEPTQTTLSTNDSSKESAVNVGNVGSVTN